MLLPLLLLPLAALTACEAPTSTTEELEAALKTGPLFVMFFAPWCGHCKQLAPVWTQVTNNLREEAVTVLKVDCTVDTALCGRYSVTGYPTVTFVSKTGEPARYSGARNLAQMSSFVLTQLSAEGAEAPPSDSVLQLTEATFSTTTAQGHAFVKFYAPWCGHCKRMAPAWQQLARALASRADVTIADVDCTQERVVCTQHGVAGYPTLLWFTDGERVGEKYAGERSLQALEAFARQRAGRDPAPATPTGGGSDSPAPPLPASTVPSLTSATFTRHIASTRPTFVKFFAPWCGHCKAMLPAYQQLAAGTAAEDCSVVEVDCSRQAELCEEQEVDGFPTLVLYRAGKEVATYSGDRTSADMAAFVARYTTKEEL